jgi:hypothetical protein
VSFEQTLPSLQSMGVLVQLPLPLQASGAVQPSPSLQGAPEGARLLAHAPAPSQASAWSQSESAGLPQAVPADWKPLSWQSPPRQVSWFVQVVPASPQSAPSATWFVLHDPAPSHASGLSQDDVDPSPQAVPADG